MAGATAATAAGVTASQASAITINLVDNFFYSSGGNHLNADLTGDGHPDLTIANAYYITSHFANVTLNGVRAFGEQEDSGNSPRHQWGTAELGGRSVRYTWVRYRSGSGYRTVSSGTRSLTGSIPIFFKDLHINGGAPTTGSLEVTVSVFGIQLDSFTYNTPVQGSTRLAAVPDQGSSLALLAMGAGGIVALRRWRAAQGRS